MMDLTNVFISAQKAAKAMGTASPDLAGKILTHLADKTEREIGSILSANRKDLEKMSVDNPMYDRLKLDEKRISDIAADIRKVAALESPLGITLDEWTRPNGMTIKKVSVPFGVVGVIYEARPNVSFDVFSICIKSGNACILKGGGDAAHSNEKIVSIIRESIAECGFDENIVCLLPSEREAVECLLKAVGYVDLIIPRGSRGLIDFVRKNSLVPTIETGAGICHTYFDKYGDRDKGRNIITNAKTRRVSVCNALDCLIVHEDRLDDLPYLCGGTAERNVEIFADEKSFKALQGRYPGHLLKPAGPDSFGTEFLSLKMAVKTVGSLAEALDHISEYSSKHSEAIISEDAQSIAVFQSHVDAACVYANVSTAFTDGGQFGFGAEIGISTQKLHARGPMALKELTTYKYLISGNGQTREK